MRKTPPVPAQLPLMPNDVTPATTLVSRSPAPRKLGPPESPKQVPPVPRVSLMLPFTWTICGVSFWPGASALQVEQLPEVAESLVIGQDWPPGEVGDVRVVLFVRLRDGLQLDAALVERIRQHIGTNTTPRHVPAKVIQVTDIPRTKSNKIVELAVRAVVHGQPVKNVEALANPEALEHFKGRPELVS